mmetsp:Transcript_15920/g.60660  ORF Transcript_15920/g.60660 Transcript_15920/m.60660 type:complete len:449 (-) Transcript_15920:480-1826(-)
MRMYSCIVSALLLLPLGSCEAFSAGSRLFGIHKAPLRDCRLLSKMDKREVRDVERRGEPSVTPGRFKRFLYHDDFVYRSCGGAAGAVARVPSAERYTSRDWMHNMLTLPSSVLLKRIRQPVAMLTLWSILIYALEVTMGFGTPKTKPHTLLSGALGLLLVFRTNAAYQRFWEGRKIWQGVQDDIRDLVRLASCHAPFLGKARLTKLSRFLCAFPWVLREHLTGLPCSPFLNLNSQEKQELREARNRPLFLINKLSADLAMVPEYNCGTSKELPGHAFTSRERLSLLNKLHQMSHRVGSAERLVQTPVPLMYARHTSRFLTIWCLTLPFVLVGELRFWTVPLMALVTWALYGIQEIGLMIENPFSYTLKLSILCDAIALDVRDTIKETTSVFEEQRKGTAADEADLAQKTALPHVDFDEPELPEDRPRNPRTSDMEVNGRIHMTYAFTA